MHAKDKVTRRGGIVACHGEEGAAVREPDRPRLETLLLLLWRGAGSRIDERHAAYRPTM